MKDDDLTKLFTEAGDAINRQWEQVGFAWEAFPQIAEAALQDGSPLVHVPTEDIYRWVLTSAQIPKQHDLQARFAQPPVTVYASDKFFIAFLFWTTSTTSIHQHAFEGAFRVFLGSSIQSTFGFTEEQRWGENLRRGQIEMQSIKLLQTGEVCAIEYGSRYIHSIYHLDNPSITLIIRTYGRTDPPEPQYDYEHPGFAVNPFYKAEQVERAKQILSHLDRINDPHLAQYVSEAVNAADAYGAYKILNHVRRMPLEAKLPAMMNQLGAKFGQEFSELVPEVLREKERASRLVLARQTVTDPEGRFFLALLLNVRDGDDFRALLAERFPDVELQKVISRWVTKLLEMKDLGIASSSFSGMLVRGMLAGIPLEEAVRKLAPILRTEEALRAVRAHGEELIHLFRPIFDSATANHPNATPAPSREVEREPAVASAAG